MEPWQVETWTKTCGLLSCLVLSHTQMVSWDLKAREGVAVTGGLGILSMSKQGLLF